MPVQSRVPRPSLFPPGYRFRLVAMVSALILIGLTIYNLRERSRTANAGHAVEAKLPASAKETEKSAEEETTWTETVIPGTADDDAVEMDLAQKEFEAIDDGEGLTTPDMFAYWRLMRWARSRSFAELEERARRDVPFVKLCDIPKFDEAKKHRGELIRLRLHVRRVVEWEQDKPNSAGVKTVYELWGTTDESKSNPYTVAVAELPPGIPVKADASSEAVFVGYFLKALKYPSEDGKVRGAPLLIGRVKAVKSGKTLAQARQEGLLAMIAIGAAILLAALIIVSVWRITRKKRGTAAVLAVPSLPTTEVEAWLERSPGEEMAAVPPEAGGSGTIVSNGQAKHAVGPATPDSTDQLE
ncbi:MAG: hypothetical protein ACM3U2_02135 [Deltaproteobacteria bacterium]